MDSHDSDFLIENPRWFYSFDSPHLYGSFYSPTAEENCRVGKADLLSFAEIFDFVQNGFTKKSLVFLVDINL